MNQSESIGALAADLCRTRAALSAARRFIDESPCDPDITAEQWAAYEQYLEAIEALEAA